MAVIGAMSGLCMFSEEEARLRSVVYLGFGAQPRWLRGRSFCI